MSPTPLQNALALLRRGWMPLPVPFRSKKPGFKSWQNFTVTEGDLHKHFDDRPVNVGVLLGEKSGWLVDIDLDCAEAVRLARHFLPPTGAVFGRKSNPHSHWEYVAQGTKTTKFADTDGAMLVELRSTGTQTIFPGSVHKETGELIEWDEEGEPAEVEATYLVSRVGRLAAAALLARRWPAPLPGKGGNRHQASLALAGGLLRAGWAEEEAVLFVKSVCEAADDEEMHARLRNILSTAIRLEAKIPTTGWPTLSKLLDGDAVSRVLQWLGIGGGADVRRETGKADHGDGERKHPYTTADGCLARHKQTKDGSVLIKMCNFSAEIAADINEDDGTLERRVYEVRGRLAGREAFSTVAVSADEFAAMKWLDKLLGASATIYAGQGEHVRCAVKLLSDNIQESKVFTYTGWRKSEEGWQYLHGGGAIGEGGNDPNVSVRLPDTLSGFVLPDPPVGQRLAGSIRHQLKALALADPTVTFTLFGGVWAAIIGGCDFAVHLVGDSGAGKSELAAIAQSHFGPGFDREHLPAAWSSTGNSLERLAHAAKDAVLVIDDFSPAGAATDISRLHREADRILRAQGNHAGRLRLRSDTSFNTARPPRGLIISTGEDVPRGQSLRARMIVLEIEKASAEHARAVDFSVLTECQRHAREGAYSEVTAAFVKWTAARYKDVLERAHGEIASLRAEVEAQSEGHKRHATTAAKLMRAWNLFFDFAHEVGAIEAHERDSLSSRTRAAILKAAKAQEAHQASQDPAARFVELITGVLSTGMGHVAWCADGSKPKANASGLGWRYDEPQGKRIGWTDGKQIYFQPDAAFALANELSAKTGSGFAVTQTTLWKRLRERGWLICEESQDTLKFRATIEGRRMRVIAMLSDMFVAGEGSE